MNSEPDKGAKVPGGIGELRRRNAAAQRILEEWHREDSKLPKDTWPQVESILKQNAMSHRKRVAT